MQTESGAGRFTGENKFRFDAEVNTAASTD